MQRHYAPVPTRYATTAGKRAIFQRDCPAKKAAIKQKPSDATQGKRRHSIANTEATGTHVKPGREN